MSFVSNAADTSVFLQVLEQIDPTNTDAVSLMESLFNNQLQMAAAITNLQRHGITVDGDIHELGESVAANTLPRLEPILQEVKDSL